MLAHIHITSGLMRLPCLLFLLLKIASSKIFNDIPYHATPINALGEWECNVGYYKTLPKNLLYSTCRKCSEITWADCPDDTSFDPCTPIHDATCVKCPPLPDTQVYTPNTHDCLLKRCQNGFYNTSSSLDCTPCPLHSYCFDGGRSECGDRLITLAPQETSPLNCIPLQDTDTWQIQLTFFFSIQSYSNEIISFCMYKREMMSAWLKYGNLIECSGNTIKNGDYDGEINCVILTTKRYAIDYMQWLDNEIEINRDLIVGFIQYCIEHDDISAFNIRILSNEPDSIYLNKNNTVRHSSMDDMVIAPPLESPEFNKIIGKKHWNNGSVATFVFTVSLLSVSICFSISLLITGICLRIRKKENQKNIFLHQKSKIKALV
jgi:hypothetical protein